MRKKALVVASIVILTAGAGTYVIVRMHAPIQINPSDIVSVSIQPVLLRVRSLDSAQPTPGIQWTRSETLFPFRFRIPSGRGLVAQAVAT